jgi:hypothetical protein
VLTRPLVAHTTPSHELSQGSLPEPKFIHPLLPSQPVPPVDV